MWSLQNRTETRNERQQNFKMYVELMNRTDNIED